MSEFAVYRTLGNGRCLVLDDTRIAGGKPDYRGNNYITSWVTNKTYGPVDELKSENAKLRELVRDVYALHWSGLDCTECPWIGECDTDGGCPWLGIMHEHMCELGVEVDG